MEKYDVIVAGSGMAGTLAAITASKEGLKVLLLDRNKKEEVGKKTNWGWVCGDAVAKSHLDFIKKHTGIEFSFPELEKKVDGVYDSDPVKNPSAVKFDKLSYLEVLSRGLGVMDSTATSLCMDNNIPLVVFDLNRKGNIYKAIMGEPIGTYVGRDLNDK